MDGHAGRDGCAYAAGVSRHPRLVDVALGGATFAVVGAAVLADVRGDGTPRVAYLFALGFGALMLVRRPFPVLTLVASGVGLLGYYALGLPPIGLALPLGAALYSAAEAGRLRWAAGTGAVLVAVSSLARTLGGEDPAYLYAYELPTTVALMAAAIALGDRVRTRRLWRAEVAERLARDADSRVQAERLALARDLHDVLAHTVSIVTLHADVAAEAIGDGDDAAARTAVGRIREASASAGRELRGTLEGLRGAPAQPLLDRLRELAADVTVEGVRRPLPQVVDVSAYRILQEAVTNARRHAPGRDVSLTVSFRPGELGLRVVNPCGPAPVGGGGHGLRGMRERVTLLGGSLRTGREPDGTFVVTATLPAEASR